MRGFSTELKVGVFSLMVLSVLAFMTFKVGGLEWTKTKGYPVYIEFRNIAGLDEKTKVRVAGVEAGVVDRIELVQGKARVKLLIDHNIRLYRDARASIKSSGLLGDKFLDINIGSVDGPQLKEGETIENVIELVDIDDMARRLIRFSDKFSDLTDSLNDILGSDESKESLRQTLVNLKEVTASLNRTIDANDLKLRRVLDNISSLTGSLNEVVARNSDGFSDTVENMRELSKTMKTSGPELVDNLNRAAKELRELVAENRPKVKTAVESVDNIAKKIEKGEGSLGKLIQDDRLYENVNKAAEGINKTISAVDRFKTILSFQGDYLTKPGEIKGSFNVTLKPTPDKYYILGVVADPLGRVTTKETITTPPGISVKEEEIEKKIEFNAQIARRFGDAAIRIGVTENTFGVGGDYFFHKDRVKLSADAWDFSNDEESAKNAHVRVGLDYFLFKDIFVSAGMDNILNKKWRGAYVGVGWRFEDEDIKYLLGSLPRVTTN